MYRTQQTCLTACNFLIEIIVARIYFRFFNDVGWIDVGTSREIERVIAAYLGMAAEAQEEALNYLEMMARMSPRPSVWSYRVRSGPPDDVLVQLFCRFYGRTNR
jgi:hypothetical protein